MSNKDMILNLDEIVEVQPIITLGGQDHTMRSMTVKSFLEAQKDADAVSKDEGGDTEQVQFARLSKVVLDSFPTMTEEMIQELTVYKLSAIADFIVKAAQAGSGGSGKKKKRAKSR